jgi:uncharacterized protein (TIGR02231 family)
MKAYLFYSIMGSAVSHFQPATEVNVADSKIEKVTVFLAGAQVQRGGTFMLQPGTSEVIFSGVSPYVDANSLQARGIGDFTIMDVKFDIKYPQPEKAVETDPNKIPADILRKMRVLSDSIETVNYQLEEVRTKKEVRTLERQMLLNNGTVKGVGKVNDSIQLLKSAMDYFHIKMTEINLDLFQLKKKEDVYTRQLGKMQSRLGELENWSANNNLKAEPVKGPVYRIIVNVNTDKAVKGKLEISYLVNQAGWEPQYDIRAKDANSPIELSYKAQVYQNSGEEWERVPLTLSSNNPYSRQQKPEMIPWYINAYAINEPYYHEKQMSYVDQMNDMMRDKAAVAPSSALGLMQKNLEEKEALQAQHFTVKTQNMINAEFEIKLPYTIKSNNEPHLVSITKEDLKAQYFLALVPKLDKNAFLVANVTNWDDLDLLPARANIYYDGTYVGQSYIDPSSMEDTLKLALGRDNNITAIRKKLKDKVKEKIIGDNKINEIAYEVNIRNAHAYPIDIIVEDQVPVSNLNDVKVEVLDKGKADLNAANGFLKWRMKVKGASAEKISFAYSIKYDKNRQLSLNW